MRTAMFSVSQHFVCVFVFLCTFSLDFSDILEHPEGLLEAVSKTDTYLLNQLWTLDFQTHHETLLKVLVLFIVSLIFQLQTPNVSLARM